MWTRAMWSFHWDVWIFALSAVYTGGFCESGVPTSSDEYAVTENTTRFARNESMTSSSTMRYNEGILNANGMRIPINKSSSMSEALCPEYCVCPFMIDKTENTLNCNGQHLFEFPSALLSLNVSSILLQNFRKSGWKQSSLMELINAPLAKSMRELRLPRNGIGLVRNSVFASLTGLKRLSLDNNQLKAVGNWTFIGLSQLSHLDLRENLIASIDLGSFSPLTELIELDLSSNKLDTIPNDLFRGLLSLKHLNLDQNQIREIQPNAMSHMPRLVHLNLAMNPIKDAVLQQLDLSELHAVQYFDLSHCFLTEVPQNLPSTIQDVRLSGNNLSSLTRKCFERYTKLAVLTLDDCNISSIENGTMHVLGSLQHLWMQNNFLRNVPSLPSKLKGVYLDQNLIRSLSRKDFEHLYDVEELRLQRNQISVIESCAFYGMPHLNLLDIRGNRLDMLNTSLFPAVNSLSRLDLSLNSLRNIDAVVFAALSMLKQLEMSRVDTLSVKSQEIFSFLPHLTVLDISGSSSLANQILHDISVHSSNITSLFSHLHTLNIRDCGISFLDKQLSPLFARLNRIKMTQNAIECTSENRWVIELIQNQPSRFHRVQDLKCFGPKSLKNQKLLAIEARTLRPFLHHASKLLPVRGGGTIPNSTGSFSPLYSGRSIASAFDLSYSDHSTSRTDVQEEFSQSWIVTIAACTITATIVSLIFIGLICCCSLNKFRNKRRFLLNKISVFLGWTSNHALSDRAASDRTLYRSHDDSIFMIGSASPFPHLSQYEELQHRQSASSRDLKNAEYQNDAMSTISSARSFPLEILV